MNNLIEQNKILSKLVKEKEYNKIYMYYGKNIYNLLTPNKYKIKDISKLMKKEKYGKIYNKYGSIRLLFVKNFYKKMRNDLLIMLEDGRFEDIYRKYGNNFYNNPSYIKYFIEQDVYNETNSNFKAKLYKNKYSSSSNLKKILNNISVAAISSFLIIGGCATYISDKTYNENLIVYNEQLNEYNKNIEEYANYINSLDLDDLQIIMKVIDDIWNDIDGYGDAKIDAYGLYRLDFLEPNGVGVCRNLADDFTAKMNAINSEYDARNIVVYFDESKYTKDSIANINIHLASTYIEPEEDNSIDISKVTGNHMVSILKPRDSNYYIVVDTTNPSIGIINNNKIYMFSNIDGKGLTYKSVGEYLMGIKDEYTSLNKIFTSSIFNNFSDEEIKKLNKQYGIDAQNNALDYVRKIEKDNTKKIKTS